MDGSHERQGVVLGEKSLPELREMLSRQEQLLQGALPRLLPDSGQRIRNLIDRLRRVIAEKEVRRGGDDHEMEDEGEDDLEMEDEGGKEIRDILLRRSAEKKIIQDARSHKFVPNRVRIPRKIDEESSRDVGELSEILVGLSLNKGTETILKAPQMSAEDWETVGRNLRPSDQCRRPVIPHFEVSLAAEASELFVVDILVDPSGDERFIELCAVKIPSSGEAWFSRYCLPGYLNDHISKRCGLRLKFKTLQEKTETSDAVLQPHLWMSGRQPSQVETLSPEEAINELRSFITGSDASPSQRILFLPPPPCGVRRHRQVLLGVLRKTVSGWNGPELMVLDLGKTAMRSELVSRLGSLSQDLNPRSRCHVIVDNLHLLPSEVIVEKLSDRLRLMGWFALRASFLHSFRHRLVDVLTSSTLSASEAESLADQGWNYKRLETAAGKGWRDFVTALLKREEASDMSDRMMMARRIFSHFHQKTKKMELHRGELLPQTEPVSNRKSILLPLSESIDILKRKPEIPTAVVQPSQFHHQEYRDPVPEEDSEDDEEEEAVMSLDSDDDVDVDRVD